MTSAAVERCTDVVIRAKLVSVLRDFYPDARLVQEWPVCAARVDVAVIHTHRLDAFEIKGETDSAARLSNQIVQYSRVFTTCTLVVHARHVLKMQKLVPFWWGIWSEHGHANPARSFECVQSPQLNPGFNGMRLALVLWHRELRALMQRKCLDWRACRSSWAMADCLARRVPPAKLTELVCEMLAKRTEWKDINDGASSSHWKL